MSRDVVSVIGEESAEVKKKGKKEKKEKGKVTPSTEVEGQTDGNEDDAEKRRKEEKKEKKRLKKEKKALEEAQAQAEEAEVAQEAPSDSTEKKKKKKKKDAEPMIVDAPAQEESMDVDAEVPSEEKKKKKRKRDTEDPTTSANASQTDASKSEKKKKKRRKDSSEESSSQPSTSTSTSSDPTPSTSKATSPGPSSSSSALTPPSSDAEVKAFLEKNSITIHTPPGAPSSVPVLSFDQLAVPTELRTAFNGFKEPTPIQSCTWPPALKGLDVVGIAETGSGKTLAFGIPALTRLLNVSSSSKKTSGSTVSVLVVAPTRELAIQTHDTLSALGKPLGIASVAVFGGVPKEGQIKMLQNANKKKDGLTTRIIVGTPGRILDLAQEGVCDLSGVDYLVLDEADRMLDKGFENDIRNIIGQTKKIEERQTMMFSATWPEAVRRLASTFQKNPVRVTVGSDDLTANSRVEQNVEVLEDSRKKDPRLLALLRSLSHKKGGGGGLEESRILVFALYKKEASRVEETLKRQGYSVGALHGDMSQNARMDALESFKTGKTSLLVATDVAARGLDIPNVGVVINYTFPLTIEDYIHRIGRTGRGGKSGKSITFFTGDNHERSLAGELARVLREGGFDNEALREKFPMTIKKKEHSVYGAFFRSDIPVPKAPTKIYPTLVVNSCAIIVRSNDQVVFQPQLLNLAVNTLYNFEDLARHNLGSMMGLFSSAGSTLKNGTRPRGSSLEDKPPSDTEADDTSILDENEGSIITSLISQLRVGMDLSRVTFPTFVLEPRSMLERITDFMSHPDLIFGAEHCEDPEERFIRVLQYYLAGWHIKPKGVKKPYNPVLGEFFRCRYDYPDGTQGFYIAEQVSHHPPISAFFYITPANKVHILGELRPKSKFLGNSVSTTMEGENRIRLLAKPEDGEYVITMPNMYARGILFGKMVLELGDMCTAKNEKRGYNCDLEFKTKGFFSGTYNAIAGRIRRGSTDVGEISGRWSHIMDFKSAKTGNKRVLFDAQKDGQNIIPKWVPPEEEQEVNESRKLWRGLTAAIVNKDMEAATVSKSAVEDAQREQRKKREESGEKHVPRFFVQKNGQWVPKLDIPNDPEEAIKAVREWIFGNVPSASVSSTAEKETCT